MLTKLELADTILSMSMAMSDVADVMSRYWPDKSNKLYDMAGVAEGWYKEIMEEINGSGEN